MLPFSEVLLEYPLCLRHPRALHSTALLHILARSEVFSSCGVRSHSIQMEEDSENLKLIFEMFKRCMHLFI